MKDIASMLVQVVAALANLKGPLFYSADEQEEKKLIVKKRKPLKRLQTSPNRKE